MTGALIADSLRYSRQTILPEIGLAGQERLRAARVLLVGLGGLGSPVALYLAAAGVGTLGLVDGDVVDASNLHRQVLHDTPGVGQLKAQSAEQRLQAINPSITLVPVAERLSAANAERLVADFDIVVDGADNFATRYLINDACVIALKPNVSGSVFRFEGQVSVFWAGHGPCYRCLFPEPPPPEAAPNCADAGVLGVAPGVIGMLQANEVLKLILGLGEPLVGRLLMVDLLAPRFREVRFARDPACPACGNSPTIKTLTETENVCQGRPTTMPQVSPEISPVELKGMLDQGTPVSILDVRNPDEYAYCKIDGSRLIPLNDLPARVTELDPDADLVIHCKLGGRSSQACAWLRQQGFTKVRNLTGGIMAWREQVDPTLPGY